LVPRLEQRLGCLFAGGGQFPRVLGAEAVLLGEHLGVGGVVGGAEPVGADGPLRLLAGEEGAEVLGGELHLGGGGAQHVGVVQGVGAVVGIDDVHGGAGPGAVSPGGLFAEDQQRGLLVVGGLADQGEGGLLVGGDRLLQVLQGGDEPGLGAFLGADGV